MQTPVQVSTPARVPWKRRPLTLLEGFLVAVAGFALAFVAAAFAFVVDLVAVYDVNVSAAVVTAYKSGAYLGGRCLLSGGGRGLLDSSRRRLLLRRRISLHIGFLRSGGSRGLRGRCLGLSGLRGSSSSWL